MPSPNTVGRPPDAQQAAEDRDHAGLAERVLARAVDVAEPQAIAGEPVEPLVERQVALGGELALAVGGERRDRRRLVERQLPVPRPRRRSRRRWRRRRPAPRPPPRAASSTLAVPPTLIAASKAGSSSDLRTSICAARWKTVSRPRLGDQRRQRRGVADVELDQLGAGRQRPVEVLPPAGREVVDDRHLVAAREQRVDQVRADESRAAGDQALIERADPKGIGGTTRPRRSGRAPLLPSPPDATDRHREEQQRQEDRRDPRRGRRRAESDKTFKVPFYTWTDADGDEQMTIGLKGHVLGPAFPEGYSNWQKTDLHDLIDAELIKEPTDKNVVKAIKKVAKEADELVIATDFDREGELIGLEALEEMLDANPELGSREGTADGSLTIQRARYSALTKEEIERAFGEPRHALLPARQRRRRPPGHRPALGRDPDPRRLARQPPLRLQLPLGRPRPEPDPGPDRRARDGAPRPRRQTVLGTVRQVPAPRRQLRGPPQRPTNSGRRPRPTRRFAGTAAPGIGQIGHGAQEHPQAADPVQHDRLQHRRLQPPRHHPRQRDADRRGPLHGRLHLLPAYRQHGLPGLAADPRAGLLAGPDQGVLRRRRPARRRAETDPRQKRDDRPPADLPDPGDPPRRPRGRRRSASTNWSCAASSPPSARR